MAWVVRKKGGKARVKEEVGGARRPITKSVPRSAVERKRASAVSLPLEVTRTIKKGGARANTKVFRVKLDFS